LNRNQLETLAFDGKVDTSGLVEEGIDQPVAMNIRTFAKFLFLRGDFAQHKTLRSMARFNLQKQDSKGRRSGYYSDEDAARLMRLSDGKLLKFSNVNENFEDYWKEAETTMKRTPYRRLLDQPPTQKNMTGKSINKSLHWNLVSAFNGTDAVLIHQIRLNQTMNPQQSRARIGTTLNIDPHVQLSELTKL